MNVQAVPAAARAVFGARLPLAEQYADLLADAGVTRGVIGPREAERIWTRHLLNCAAITDLFAPSVRVVDVGSGAGLPGLAIAIRRPDLSVDLLEPLQRRVDFLAEVVDALGLGAQVRVVRGRAEEPTTIRVLGDTPWVTARAVAPLNRLISWCAPLLACGGRLAAVKGSTAAAELREHGDALEQHGMSGVHLEELGSGLVEPAVTVVVGTRTRSQPRTGARGRPSELEHGYSADARVRAKGSP